MLKSTVRHNLIVKDYSKSLTTAGTTPASEGAKTHRLINFGKVRTIDELMKNTRLYTCAVAAYRLGDMPNQKGLVGLLLEQAQIRSTGLANILSNLNSKACATALNFGANGSAAISTTGALTGIISGQGLDAQIGQQSPSVEMELHFKRNVGSISIAYRLLGGTTILKLLKNSLEFSNANFAENIDTQSNLVATARSNTARNISSFQNTIASSNFLQGFTANHKAENPSLASTSFSLALDHNFPRINSNLLLSMANLKIRGP